MQSERLLEDKLLYLCWRVPQLQALDSSPYTRRAGALPAVTSAGVGEYRPKPEPTRCPPLISYRMSKSVDGDAGSIRGVTVTG